jgi:hypothetical protein
MALSLVTEERQMPPQRPYNGPERRQSDRMVLSELKDAVSQGVDEAIRKTFVTLGLDLTDPEDIERWYADRAWISQRRADEEARKHAGIAGNVGFRNGVITVLLSTFLAWLISQWHK